MCLMDSENLPAAPLRASKSARTDVLVVPLPAISIVLLESTKSKTSFLLLFSASSSSLPSIKM